MCTGIRLVAQNGAVCYGRTLEFAKNLESDIVFIPRRYSFAGMVPSGKAEGLQWKSKYAVVGANAANFIEIADGVNECGLAGGLFYFSEYARYQDISMDEFSRTIAPWQLITWILTQFSTLDEIKAALHHIRVSNTIFQPWGFVIPLHAIVHDVKGQSLVIEYVQGKLTTYDNPLGIITNAPSFDWHITNMSNYVNLTPFNRVRSDLFNSEVKPFSQGSGMLGLPGDFTSPSRFVRAAAFSRTVIDTTNENETRDTAFHILNLFNIPRGTIRQTEDQQVYYDYTQWTSVTDLANKHYYFTTYDNRQIRMVDLAKMDLNANEHLLIPMQSEQSILNVSPNDTRNTAC